MTTILPRRGTAAQWTAANPVLAMGEEGYETDTTRWKRGDGTTAWTALAYYQPAWTDVTAKPAVIAAGADQAAARGAIGAGTSNLAIGTTGTTAKAGNYQPAWTDVTAKPAVIAAGADQVVARSAIGALSQTEIENLIGNYESESLSLFNRMAVRPDADRRSAINTLIGTLKNTGIWAKLDGLYLFAAHTSQAGLLNWIAPNRDMIAFNSPIFTVDRGFAGDGISSYVATNAFNGSGLKATQGDESLGCWIRTNQITNNTSICIARSISGATTERFINPANSGNKIAWRMNSDATQSGGPVHTSNDNMCAVVTNSSGTGYQYYNGGLEDDYASAYVNDPQAQASLFLSVNRIGSLYATRETSAVFHGKHLTAGEVTNIYNALYDYIIALGALL